MPGNIYAHKTAYIYIFGTRHEYILLPDILAAAAAVPTGSFTRNPKSRAQADLLVLGSRAKAHFIILRFLVLGWSSGENVSPPFLGPQSRFGGKLLEI